MMTPAQEKTLIETNHRVIKLLSKLITVVEYNMTTITTLKNELALLNKKINYPNSDQTFSQMEDKELKMIEREEE